MAMLFAIRPGYKVDVVDTTGAGDAFLGATLYGILQLKNDFIDLSGKELNDKIDFANVVGALTTTKKGAISSIPSIEEIFSFLNIL